MLAEDEARVLVIEIHQHPDGDLLAGLMHRSGAMSELAPGHVSIDHMERVTVRTYREGDSPLKRFGAHYERATGQRTVITSGERGSQFAKDKAAAAVYECEWELFRMDRKDGFLDIGHGWIDGPESVSN